MSLSTNGEWRTTYLLMLSAIQESLLCLPGGGVNDSKTVHDSGIVNGLGTLSDSVGQVRRRLGDRKPTWEIGRDIVADGLHLGGGGDGGGAAGEVVGLCADGPAFEQHGTQVCN